MKKNRDSIMKIILVLVSILLVLCCVIKIVDKNETRILPGVRKDICPVGQNCLQYNEEIRIILL